MKLTKRIVSILLALSLVLALATTAFAATVTVEQTGHTYKAYQILTGTQAESEGALGDVAWGSGINAEAFLAALKADDATKTEFAAVTDAKSFAEELAEHADKSDIANAVARIAYANKTDVKVSVAAGSENNLADGYYLIVDVTDVDDKHDAKNAALLQVTDDITIEVKTDKPTSEKKVDDEDDSVADDPETDGVVEGEDATNWQDSADYDVGDAVPFKLTATLPNNVTSYNKYYLAFHDVQSAGLTFNADSVKVYVDDKQITTGYTVNTAATDGCTFEVVINDVRAVGAGNGSVITVEYTSTLNNQAVMGEVGNPNTMHIEYSNNPNQVWDGEGKPDTGKTPDDKVIVFTYKVVVNKTDSEGEALEGAGFTLYKKNAAGEYVAVGAELTGDAMTTFTWERLDAGEYRLVETTTPAGYNTIAPIEFTITAEHQVESDDPRLTGLSGNVTSGEAEFTPALNDGSLTTGVVNKAGTILPETGGIGTTLFYVIGGLLVAGAVVLLVTKKRMSTAA